MKKKVLQFIHGLNMGGAETLVKEYCLKLDKEKYDVSILCFYKYHTPIEKQLEDRGIKITYLEDINVYEKQGGSARLRRVWLFLKRIVLVRQYIKREKPDIIHSHLNNNTYVWLANPKKGTKIFHTVHNELSELWDESFESKLDYHASKCLIKTHQMRFIALHDRMRVETNAFFGVEDTVILNNGIDFERFEAALPKMTVRKNEDIPEDALVLGHVGRFNEQKNHSFLVDVFFEIYKKNRNAYLLMVGNGDLMPEIAEKLQNLGLESCYKILSYRMDIPDLLSAMDYFMLPSIYEGLGIVLIEAQKMGIPCIASSAVPDAAKISNLIKKLDLQLSASQWADEILEFQPKEIAYFGLEDWDIREVTKKMEKIYEE